MLRRPGSSIRGERRAGKSVGLLIAALQWIDEPGYSALILRRTYAQLAKSDSILNKSKEWLRGKAHWTGLEHKWTFPNGNTLEFGHMASSDDMLNYQGGSWPFIGVDECTQFTGEMLAYPRSRQRRVVGSRIPIRWRGATNPGGIGHEHVKGRYVKDANGKSPCTPDRQFFPATLADNPNIDRDDYIRQLQESGIDPLTLAQLLAGDWDAVAGGRFHRDWFRDFDYQGELIRLRLPDGTIKGDPFDRRKCLRFLTCDPAASISTQSDYTVVSAWCVSPNADLVWLGCDRFKAEIPDIVPRIGKSYKRWNAMYAGIETCQSNRAVFQLAQRSRDPVIVAHPMEPGGKDKLVRATGFIILAANGRVYLPTNDPTFPRDEVLSELVRFTGVPGQDATDDIVDAASQAADLMSGMPTADQRKKGFPKVLGGG